MLLEEFGKLLCMQKDDNTFWRLPPQYELPKEQSLQACRAQDTHNPAADSPAALLCAAMKQTNSARPGARIGRSVTANGWLPCSFHRDTTIRRTAILGIYFYYLCCIFNRDDENVASSQWLLGG